MKTTFLDHHTEILTSLAKLAEEHPGVNRAKVVSMLRVPGRYHPFIGFNQMKSHPLQARYSRNSESIFLHAEIDAIRQALKEMSPKALKGSTMHIARVKHPDGDIHGWCWGLGKPCVGCAKALKEYGIDLVYYTTDSHGVYEEIDFK